MTSDAGVLIEAKRVERPTRRRFTIHDILRGLESGAIDPDARIELIHGEIVDMPVEGLPHADFKSEIIAFFARHLLDRRKLMTETVLVLSDSESPVPELFVYERGAEARPIDMEHLHIVVEVSDSTLRYDLGTKRSLYESWRVPELWIVDVRSQTTLVHVLDSEGSYGRPARVAFSQPLRPRRLPEIELIIDDLPTG